MSSITSRPVQQQHPGRAHMMKSSIFAAYEEQAAASKPQAPPSQSVAVGSNVSLLNQQQQSFHQESKHNAQHMTTSRIFASPTPSPGAVIAPSKAMVQPSNTVVELEHAVGFAGLVPRAAVALSDQHFLTVAGACLVVNSALDKHQQHFLRGHDDIITCLDVSPSRRLAASGQRGQNADVIVWDLKSLKPVFRLSEHYHGISAVAFSDDERFLATVGDTVDKRLYIWDLKSGNIVSTAPIGHTNSINWGGRVKDIKNRPTAVYQLASTSTVQQSVTMWVLDPAVGSLTAEKCRSSNVHRQYSCGEFSAEGDVFFAGSNSGDVSVFSTRTKTLQSQVLITGAAVTCITRSEAGWWWLGCSDGSVVCYKGAISKDALPLVQGRRGAAISAISCVPAVELKQASTDIIIGTVAGDITRCGVVPYTSAQHGPTTVDAAPYRLSYQPLVDSHAAPVTALSFAPASSDRFVTCSVDGTVKIWDAVDVTVIAQAHMGVDAQPAVISFGQDVIVIGCGDGSIRGIDVTGKLLWKIAEAHKEGVTALQIAPNQKFLVSGGAHGEVRAWNLRTREMVCNLKQHQQPVTSLEVLADNRHLVSCGRDRCLLSWDLQTEQRISCHKQATGGLNALRVVPSGSGISVLTGGQERSLTLWELSQPKASRVIGPAHEGDITCIGVSHSGKMAVTGGSDHMLRLWEVGSGKCIAECVGHSAPVTAAEFSADDKQVVSVGLDACVLIWNVFSLQSK